MTSNPGKNKNAYRRTAWQIIFGLLVLATAWRLVESRQLPGPTEAGRPPVAGLDETSPSGSSPGSQIPATVPADAHLAELYAMCPMAATVDLTTVVEHPEEVDKLLPPYRLTANRVPQSPAEPAMPRIRYPIAVRSSVATDAQFPSEPLHVALQSKPADPSAAGSATNGDWLVDPNEWYTPEENQPQAPNEDKPPSDPSPPSEQPAPNILPAEQPQSADETAKSAAPEAIAPSPPSVTPELPPDPAVEPPAVTTPPPPADSPPDNSLFLPPAEELPPPTPPATAPAAPPAQPTSSAAAPAPAESLAQVDPHLELFAKNAYPSARECAQCHEDIYHEWSVSAHAYAAVSPMFHKFEQKLNDLSNGTVGYFCMRCHAPVATALCASRAEPLWNLPEVVREGITCIACHRVQYVYGKANGERRIEPGNVFAPVMGGIGGHGVAEAIHRKDHFKVKTAPPQPSPERGGSIQNGGPGQNIHVAGIYFDPLTRSEFCTPCHQVAVHPGIKLEVVWEQYRASPACKKGIQCQDCHMGRVPGLPLGYDVGPVAKIADKTVNDHRKKSNHIFYGPNYSIAHPGIFPFHLKANRWTMDQWLLFDWRAGWGTDAFEDRVADGEIEVAFPPVWAEADDRYDAREIIDDNLKKLNHKRDIRVEIMENGSHVDGPHFESPPRCGQDLKFHYVVTNTNEGHNLLTASLGAQPQFWANVVLIGPDGQRLWETGYLDSLGDLANIHSEDVRNKRIPYDHQLFNLQTMFLITGVKGTDREFFVPVNVDIDQLPFIRPGVQPITVINHPPFIRMESQSLAPLGSRKAKYRIPGHLVRQPGTYRLSFRMRSRAEPLYFMRFCDATPDMIRAMNEWMVDVHPMTVEFTVR